MANERSETGVTDKEALQAYSRNEELNQPTIERLWKAGYIEVHDMTTLDTPGSGKVLKAMAITMRGQMLLKN
jgi:hypothetical protein